MAFNIPALLLMAQGWWSQFDHLARDEVRLPCTGSLLLAMPELVKQKQIPPISIGQGLGNVIDGRAIQCAMAVV